jgi:hypothetical protein
MKAGLKKLAIPGLRWWVGLVVLWESFLTMRAAHSKLYAPGHSGTLVMVRLVLSGSEIVAAALFLLSPTMVAGGYLLLLIFALAIAIHTLHGDFAGLEVLVVDGMAVLVSLAYREGRGTPPSRRVDVGPVDRQPSS